MKKEIMNNGNTMIRTLFVSLLALVALGSCAEPEPSLLINAHVFLTGAKIDEPDELDESGACEHDFTKCKVSKVGDEQKITYLLKADVAKVSPQVTILMQNRLLSTEDYAQLGQDSNLRLDTNSVQLTKAEVTFGGQLKSLGLVQTQLGSIVSPDGSFHFSTDLVKYGNADKLKDAVSALAGGGGLVTTSVDIQIFGKTLSGTEVVSNIITLPLELCSGCISDEVAKELSCSTTSIYRTAACVP